MPEPRGTPVHGEISSADAHLGVKVQMYEPGGGTVTIEGASTTTGWEKMILNVTDLTVISVPGGVVKIESITAAGTLTLFKGTVAANGGCSRSFSTPFQGLRTGTLTLTAPAGQVDVQVEGYLTR